MIFTKLELNNFKSHAHTVLDFNPGISLIVGENGAGKSTILEAISFALFKVSNTKNDNLIRTNKDMNEKIEMSVKLNFIQNAKEYRVERSLTRTKSSSRSGSNLFLIDNGHDEIIASGDTSVNEEIQAITSMDKSTFLNAIHIMQGEIADLIDKGPADRKRLIGELLKLDQLENAYKKLPEISKEYETRKAVLEDRIRPEVELNFELKKTKQEHFELSENIKVQREDLDRLEEEISKTNEDKEKLDKLKSEFETLSLKLAHEEENLNSLKKLKNDLYEKYSEILRYENEMNILKPSSEKLPIYKDFKDSFLKLSKLKVDEEKNKELLKQIEGYKNTIAQEKENHEKFINMEAEIKALIGKKAELSSEVKRINELEKEKDNLEKDIGQYGQDLDKFSNKSIDVLSNFDLEEEIAPIKTNDDLNHLDGLVEGLRTKIRNEIDNISEDIDALRKDSISLNQEIKSLDEPLSDIRKVENKCPVCQSEISEDKKNELIHTYETTISNNNKKISENTQKLDKLNKEKSIKESKLKDLDLIKTNIYQNKHLVDDIAKLNKRLESLNLKINELQGKKDDLESLDKIMEVKNSEFKDLEEHNKKYLEASTLLKSAPDETKLKDELYSISGNIKLEDEKLKKFISLDSKLSLDITEEELDKSIGELAEKDKRYNILFGAVKAKDEYEGKLKAKEKEIETKSEEISAIKKAIESSQYDEENYKHMIILIDRLNKKFNESSKELAVNENNLNNFEITIGNLEELIEINRKNNEEFKAVDEYLQLLKYFRDMYSKDGIQEVLRSHSKPLIQKYTREFFEKFNFNYSDLILDDEYNISVFGPEGEANLDMVSGGEKIAIALALRLGITQAMSQGNIETILLDEPTIHLDSYRRQELINVLRSMSVIPQMLIVTHDQELETAADTLILVEKEDGISQVKVNN